MPVTDLQIEVLVAKYLRERDRYEKMAATVHRILQLELRNATIPCLVTFRAKDDRSLRGKLARDRADISYTDVEHEFFPGVKDLAGVRVLLYRPQDVDPTCTLIERVFLVPAEQRFRTDHAQARGYRARHRVATIREETRVADANLLNLEGVYCEIQVTTIVDHIWNEPEHEIRYKSATGDPSDQQAGLLRVLRSQLDAVADMVAALMEATNAEIARKQSPLQGADELRRALETMHERALNGDFSRLFDILTKTHRSLTSALLEGLPVKKPEFAEARAILASLGDAALQPDDDVAAFVVALWPAYGADISEICESWRDAPTPLLRLIETLQQRDAGNAPV